MRLADLQEADFRRYFESRLAGNGFRKSGTGYMALCPFHADKNPSLSISTERGCWKCHTGCGQGGVVEFERKFSGCDAQTAMSRIGEIVGQPQLNLGQQPEAIYQYVDADGRDYFQVVRYSGKRFAQRKRNPSGGWDYKTSDLRMVLYHLPEVVGANEVCVTEGEKDADNLRTAIKAYYDKIGQPPGRVAVTTSPRGAAKWRDDFAPYFCGKRVTIFQDNDEPGTKHAKRVAESVHRFANGVKIISLPGVKDVSEFLAAGHTVDEIVEIVKRAPVWKLAESATSLFMSVSEFHEKADEQIDWLVENVIQCAANGIFIARPKVGKSFVVLDLALALAGGQNWLDFHVPRRVRTALVSREDTGGLTRSREIRLQRDRRLADQELDGWLWINAKGLRPRIMLDYPDDVTELVSNLKRHQSEFLILDVMRVLHGRDENDNTEMQKVIDVLNSIQDQCGCSILLVHHDNKRDDATLTERARGASAIAGYAEFMCGIRVVDETDWTREFCCELKAAMAPDKFHFRILDTADAGVKLERVEWHPPDRKKRRQNLSEEEVPF
jgi:AAA domain/CHC2 zinc finger